MVAEYIGETKSLRKEGFELNLKNEKERKKFLKGYQEWPVWFQVRHHNSDDHSASSLIHLYLHRPHRPQ